MNIKAMGTVANFVKTMKLQKQWQDRKKNPLMAKGQQEDSRITAFRKRMEEDRKKQAITNIENKMRSGAKLSGAEMEHLKNNAPELYQKAVAIEKQREAYQKELAKCSSKEEARNLHASIIARHISDKSAGADYTAMIVAALQSEYVAFSAKPEYQSLPDTIRNDVDSEITAVQPATNQLEQSTANPDSSGEFSESGQQSSDSKPMPDAEQAQTANQNSKPFKISSTNTYNAKGQQASNVTAKTPAVSISIEA